MCGCEAEVQAALGRPDEIRRSKSDGAAGGRGWYSRLSQAVPLDAKPVAKLIRAVEKAFPLLRFALLRRHRIEYDQRHLWD